MGLFGGGNTSSNTTNVSNTTTNVRDIGITGRNAVAIVETLTREGRETNREAFNFTRSVIGATLDSFDTNIANQTNSLNNITLSARDFSQRAISAGTGQETPIQTLRDTIEPPAAVDRAGDSKTIQFLAIAAVVVAILSMK